MNRPELVNDRSPEEVIKYAALYSNLRPSENGLGNRHALAWAEYILQLEAARETQQRTNTERGSQMTEEQIKRSNAEAVVSLSFLLKLAEAGELVEYRYSGNERIQTTTVYQAGTLDVQEVKSGKTYGDATLQLRWVKE